ncbi:MAG TPA: hypothetical protein V6D11_21000 [Waterburya sp.]
MPPASSGRYQSRFFNFLNRQSLRLKDQFERTARQIKVTAVWGAQVVLYPLYLLVQGSLSVGRQIAAEAEAGWPRLKEFSNKEHKEQLEVPLDADTPIQRVLEELNVGRLQLNRLESEDLNPLLNLQPSTVQPSTVQPSTPANERCVIQGVASLLTTRSLVLVTVENQILDILTPQQQQKLASKIRWEVADLLRHRRLAQSSKLKQATPRLSSLDQPRVFLPVRVFWQVMAWVQTSPVAIAANLFQESTLVDDEIPSFSPILPPRPTPQELPQLPASNEAPIANPLVPQQTLAFLDRAIAQLESHPLVPGTEALGTLRDSLRDKWNSSPLSKVKIQNFVRNLVFKSQPPISTSSESAPTPEASQAHSFQIQALIYAAIEYFFGGRGATLSGSDTQERSARLTNSQGEAHPLAGRHSPSLSPAQSVGNSERGDVSESDPWLSWSDLFGNPKASDSIPYSKQFSQEKSSKIPAPESQAQLPEAFNSKMPIKPRNSFWEALKRLVSPKPSQGKLSAPNREKSPVESQLSVRPQPGKLKPTPKTPPLTTQKRDKGSLSKKRPTSSSVAGSSRHPDRLSPRGQEDTAITPSSSSAQDTNLEPAPDWIETQATPSGYVKHPLVQVLEWLDVAILWLEELLVKVWQWLRQRRR